MENIEVILFSQTVRFLKITKDELEKYDIYIKNTIKNINNIDTLKKNRLYIVDMPINNIKKEEEIMDFFEKNNLNWICISDNVHTNFKSISKGAILHIILKKREVSSEYSVFIKLLSIKIKTAKKAMYEENIRYNNLNCNKKYNKIIAIGASTGGTDAIIEILTKLEKDTPPIIIVIHMPSGFTGMYAKKLNEICKMYVKEARNKDIIRNGVVYIAKGGRQLRVLQNNGELFIQYNEKIKVNGHCPSIDVLFDSINQIGMKKIAIILTGMGDDGAKKITEIRKKGGLTIGQDKQTSIVYGMPKVAYNLGGILIQAPIYDIANIIKKNI